MAFCRLDAVADLVTEKVTRTKRPEMPYVGLEHLASGSPDLLGTASAESSVSTNNVFDRGDTLFGKLRPNLRKAVHAPFAGYCSTDIIVLRARSGVDPRYVTRLCQSEAVAARAIQTAIGTKMPRTSWSAVREVIVWRPEPGAEHAICDVLDSMDATIRATERLIAKLHALKQGLLYDTLTVGIDDNGEIRDRVQRPEAFKDSALGPIPSAWRVVPLGKVVPRATYGISVALDEAGDIPVLRMNNLRDGEADLSEVRYSNTPQVRDLLLQPGDVLFNRTNSIDHVGRTGIWRGQLHRASFASYLVRLELDQTTLRSEFLTRWLNWPVTQIRIRAYATPGVQQVNINPTNLRRTLIAMPDSLAEQDRINDALNSIEKRLQEEQQQHAKLVAVRKGLMDDLLTGRVHVQHEAAEKVSTHLFAVQLGLPL